jgi:hypothetical protein
MEQARISPSAARWPRVASPQGAGPASEITWRNGQIFPVPVAGPPLRVRATWRKSQLDARGGRTLARAGATASHTVPHDGAATRLLVGRSTPPIPLAYVDPR